MASGTILFLHGFASSARAAKARYLGDRFATRPQVDFCALDFNPTPQDFEYMTASGRIGRLRQYVLDHGLQRFSIIGSSFGGLIALHYAHRFGGVEKLLLLAPVLRWLPDRSPDEELEEWRRAGITPVFHYAFEKELPLRYTLEVDGQHYQELIPPPAPVTIIHGNADDAVPVDDSRQYVTSFPDLVHLVEIEADHDLNDHLDLIWRYVESFLLDPEQEGE